MKTKIQLKRKIINGRLNRYTSSGNLNDAPYEVYAVSVNPSSVQAECTIQGQKVPWNLSK